MQEPVGKGKQEGWEQAREGDRKRGKRTEEKRKVMEERREDKEGEENKKGEGLSPHDYF